MNAATELQYLTDPDGPPPPWSSEAEQSVLGALLLENAALDQIGSTVHEAAFWLPAHRAIWSAMVGLIGAGKPADVITVAEALKARSTPDEYGGMGYLNSLSQSVPSARNARRYAEIVAEKAAQRATIAAADLALSIAKEDGPADEKLDRIAVAFSGVQRTQMKAAPRRIGELVLSALDRYSELADGKRTPAWSTGMPDLDRTLNGGLRPGKVYGIGARPSIGKSSMARAIAIALAIGGHPTLILSQEMPGDEVADCTVAQLGRVESGRLQTGKLSHEDWSGISEAAETAAGLPLYIDDDGGLTPAQIAGKARSIKGLRVLVLDYLQLSTSTIKGGTTNDQVAEISKALKQLAMRMGIAIVVLSQLSRKIEERADREPQLSDLRDSGAIEQDLDVAILIWTVREPDTGPRVVGCKVDKHRGGRKGRFGLYFDAAIYAWSPAPGELAAADSMPRTRGRTGGFKE
jgi:replicative DNA helicase